MKALLWGTLGLLLTLGQASWGQTVEFRPLQGAAVSSERGWWRFAGENFLTATTDDMKDTRQNGMTLVYGVVRLDPYRKSISPGSVPDDLRLAFDRARAAGVKVILRFVYNYPESSQEYENAQDAPLEVVLAHIEALAPVIADNADTIAVWQAGFIGAWGEGHTSSNDLDTDENKAIIRDAILAAAPEGMHLQWRYPADLIAWEAEKKRGRFGMNNDCFLSSNTDVGSYSENKTLRGKQRAAIAAMTRTTYFSGETCDAEPESIRKDCASILREGKQFRLSALGIDYYTKFHKAWKAEGCYDDVSRRLGYRLVLVKAKRENGKLRVWVRNDGWARLMHPRKMKLKLGEQSFTFGPEGLETISPGETVRLTANLPSGPLPRRFCVAAPDPSPRLAGRAAYGLRFANANRSGQEWKDGMFCFRRP